jgi:hypothetical protein
MTSRQLLDFIKAGLKKQGAAKIIPVDGVLEEHARRLIERHLAQEAIEKLQTEFVERAQKEALPEDLRRRLQTALANTPKTSWDAALASIIRRWDLAE